MPAWATEGSHTRPAVIARVSTLSRRRANPFMIELLSACEFRTSGDGVPLTFTLRISHGGRLLQPSCDDVNGRPSRRGSRHARHHFALPTGVASRRAGVAYRAGPLLRPLMRQSVLERSERSGIA